MSGQTVLILSTEPIVGALLGIYAELHAYRPVFAGPSQTSDDAVAQSNPSIIVLDLEYRDGVSAAFVSQQRAAGRSVIAFSSRASADEVVRRANRLGVPCFLMPIDAAGFDAALNRATGETKREG